MAESVSRTLKNRVLGGTFLVILALFVALTYAIFNKSFTSYDDVTLHASRIGLQLPKDADVKIRGLQVGVVRGFTVTPSGADLNLGIYPGEADTIPANVTARILPKTLFGEKYVALQPPASPSPQHIQSGDVIAESHVAIEVEKVLSDIYPLLRTVQPAQLNYTLTALADALEGRGAKLGASLVTLDSYLKRENPQIPLLVDDLRKLSSVSDTYRSVVPELVNLLRNSVTTGRTFASKDQKVRALFNDVASFSSTSRDFLQQNGQNIILLSKQGQAQLPMYARYSPEYPCLLKGIVGAIPRESEAFRGHTLHINLETLPKQPRGYQPGDTPAWQDTRGPLNVGLCNAAMNGRWNQANLLPKSLMPNLKDGVNYPLGKNRPATGFDMTSGYAGTTAERDLVSELAAPVLGLSADRVPGIATLLFGPLARGSEVSVQ